MITGGSAKKQKTSLGASEVSSPPTLAIIGGGPGAMFVCHAIETQKKELEAKGEDTSSFPIVKAFERAAGPGGVWRSDREHDGDIEMAFSDDNVEEKKDDRPGKEKTDKAEKTCTNMYAALWTNGCKEHFEFYDYTFKDHFGDVKMPSYLPRKHVLGYLLARVTSKCPDFFDRYFHFRTTVQNVRYLQDKGKFRVCTFNDATQEECVEFFDKCVWAGGNNGIQNIPTQTVKLLEDGGFSGRWFHSSETSTFKEDVEGKNVLMVGGELSVEDLVLMAIKEGAQKIYVTARDEDCTIMNTPRWPYDKVEVCEGTAIRKVKGKNITLHEVSYSLREGKYVVDHEEDPIELSDIDTVIFCTGYKKNTTMLDPDLCDCLGKWNTKMSIPKDWKPEKNKLLKKLFGDGYQKMRPKDDIVLAGKDPYFVLHDGMYESCFNINNPNIMFMLEFSDSPLMFAEVTAWMIAKVVTNQIPLPSPTKMRQENVEYCGNALQYITLRYDMDLQYREAVDVAIEKYHKEIKEDEWGWGEEYTNWRLGLMTMNYDYPVKFLDENDTDEWGDYWNAMEKCDDYCAHFRKNLHEIVYDTKVEKDGWKTFRDIVPGPDVKSFFTGIESIPLPKPWEELHEDDLLW